MADHDHDHDHDHEGDAGHHHGHSHGHPPGENMFSGPPMDAASASLARALQMSFRLLTLIMFVVVIAFLFTGMTTVNSDEMGVITVLGRQAAVVGPGLHYTWPYPVGSIQKVSTAQKTAAVDFWPWLSPDDQAKEAKGDLSQISWMEKGMRPGIDESLLTGDAYLFHAKILCTYVVDDPAVYLGGIADPNFRGQDVVTGEAVQTAVKAAAVRAAARRTAEGLMLGREQVLFTLQIQNDAQNCLKKMGAGVHINQITLVRWTWPLRALPDYQRAQSASQNRSTIVQAAIGAASETVRSAAGEINFRKLVGEPWKEAEPGAATRPASEDYDLIGQYEAARADANFTLAQREAILTRIDEILLSQSTQGAVTTILRAATVYRDAQKRAVDARASNLEKVLAEYNKAPEFFLQRMWTEAREEILQSPTVVKWFLDPAQGKTVITVNTPPEINRELGKTWLQAPK
jgi:membrane protease subunit HflK